MRPPNRTRPLRTFLICWAIGLGLVTASYLTSFWLFMDIHLVTDDSAPWPQGDIVGPRTYWSLNDTRMNRFIRNLYDPLITWKFDYPEDWHTQSPSPTGQPNPETAATAKNATL